LSCRAGQPVCPRSGIAVAGIQTLHGRICASP
jgi:hypothetical protein